MEIKCEHYANCGFFLKWNERCHKSCMEIMRQYCLGDKTKKCKRLAYFIEHDKVPSDDMQPNGEIIP